MKDSLLKWDGHQLKVVVGDSQYLSGYLHRVYEDHLVLVNKSIGLTSEIYIPFHAIRYWEPMT